MKKLQFFFILMIGSSSVSSLFAQNYTLGAKWYYQKFCDTPTYVSDCGYFTAEIVRDTLINGLQAKIMEYTDNGVIVVDAQIVIREDNNRVYFYENNQFKLLYDFNLNAGDTLTFKIPFNWHYYDVSCFVSPDTSKTARVIVDSTKQLMINGQSLKTLYTTPIYIPLDTNYNNWQLSKIIERVGNTFGFFGHNRLACLSGFPGNFRCYSDSLINYKTVAVDCDFITNINESVIENLFSVFPNPFNNKVNIELKEITGNEKYFIVIRDIFGNQIIRRNLHKGSNTIFFTPQLPKGIYFYTFQNKNTVSSVQKMIKIN